MSTAVTSRNRRILWDGERLPFGLPDLRSHREIEKLGERHVRCYVQGCEQRLPYQLWRNLLFAEWMARADSPGTEPFVLNLVRKNHERRSHDVMSRVIDPQFHHRLLRCDWEHAIASLCQQGLAKQLTDYLSQKTAGLRPAFEM